MALAPRSRVVAPLAAPPRVGLLPSIAAVQEQERWEAGFSFAPEGCGSSGVGNPCGSAPKEIAANEAVVDAEPYYVWAGDKCAPFELGRDWQGRARRQLLASESYQVASELWRGDLAQTEVDAGGEPWPNRYLASEAADVVAGEAEPTGIVDAVSCLEYALGRCAKGQRGMLHVTRQAAIRMASENLLRREGNLLLTTMDTIVVADAGYDGSGPYGAATADEQWLYATGMVLVRLGEVATVPEGGIAQAVDRSTNLVEYRAERLAAATWGCCHLAARIDIGLCAIGGAGS